MLYKRFRKNFVLIIDDFENRIDEKLIYSILNQSKQYENFIVINSCAISL